MTLTCRQQRPGWAGLNPFPRTAAILSHHRARAPFCGPPTGAVRALPTALGPSPSRVALRELRTVNTVVFPQNGCDPDLNTAASPTSGPQPPPIRQHGGCSAPLGRSVGSGPGPLLSVSPTGSALKRCDEPQRLWMPGAANGRKWHPLLPPSIQIGYWGAFKLIFPFLLITAFSLKYCYLFSCFCGFVLKDSYFFLLCALCLLT